MTKTDLTILCSQLEPTYEMTIGSPSHNQEKVIEVIRRETLTQQSNVRFSTFLCDFSSDDPVF